MWPRGKTIEDATVVGEEDRGLYKLKGKPTQTLFHESCHSFESFKRMHCPLSFRESVPFSHAAKSCVLSPDVQREVE